jgi:hypothetical protein
VPGIVRIVLLQMLGEELGGAVPGELRALSIIGRTRFIAEGVAGVIPVRLKGHLAFFQLGFESSGAIGREGGVFLSQMKLKRYGDGLDVAGLLGWKTIPRRARVHFFHIERRQDG